MRRKDSSKLALVLKTASLSSRKRFELEWRYSHPAATGLAGSLIGCVFLINCCKRTCAFNAYLRRVIFMHVDRELALLGHDGARLDRHLRPSLLHCRSFHDAAYCSVTRFSFIRITFQPTSASTTQRDFRPGQIPPPTSTSARPSSPLRPPWLWPFPSPLLPYVVLLLFQLPSLIRSTHPSSHLIENATCSFLK